jgi:hypothetical protein
MKKNLYKYQKSPKNPKNPKNGQNPQKRGGTIHHKDPPFLPKIVFFHKNREKKSCSGLYGDFQA